MKTAFKYVMLATSFCLLAAPTFTSAAPIDVPTKKQAFKLDPKKQKSAFIDFGAFDNKIKKPKGKKTSAKFGKVKFKAKPKGKKKPDAIFDFGAPTRDPNGRDYLVSVELLSMSLVSTAPVSLDPFLGEKSGQTGFIGLTLRAPASKKAAAKLDPKNKKKGSFGFGLSKLFDVSKIKSPGAIKPPKKKALTALDLGTAGVPFSQQSPITVTAPFCLESGANASICLAPIGAAVPASNSFSLAGIGLAAIALLALFRRRSAASNERLLAI